MKTYPVLRADHRLLDNGCEALTTETEMVGIVDVTVADLASMSEAKRADALDEIDANGWIVEGDEIIDAAPSGYELALTKAPEDGRYHVAVTTVPSAPGWDGGWYESAAEARAAGILAAQVHAALVPWATRLRASHAEAVALVLAESPTTPGEIAFHADRIKRGIEEASCFDEDGDSPEENERTLPLSAKRLPLPGPRARQFGDFSRLGRR